MDAQAPPGPAAWPPPPRPPPRAAWPAWLRWIHCSRASSWASARARGLRRRRPRPRRGALSQFLSARRWPPAALDPARGHACGPGARAARLARSATSAAARGWPPPGGPSSAAPRRPPRCSWFGRTAANFHRLLGIDEPLFISCVASSPVVPLGSPLLFYPLPRSSWSVDVRPPKARSLLLRTMLGPSSL